MHCETSKRSRASTLKGGLSKGYDQEELADLAGLGRTHLRRPEFGTQSMTLRTLKIIADALGVTVRSLIGRI
jgi:transcriptional regulator with XRE-family HTH domain